MIDVSAIIDDFTKLVSTTCGVVSVVLLYWKALPEIKEIRAQTNGLVAQAQAGVHAMGVKEGVKEGLEQATASQAVTAKAISTVVDIATDKVIAAVKLAKEG